MDRRRSEHEPAVYLDPPLEPFNDEVNRKADELPSIL